MCKPASFVVTKDRIFWSRKTDSHTEIIAEFGLCESIANASPATARSCLVKVEISPENGDLSAPTKQWKFKVDQDIVPKWFNPETVETAVRKELRSWLKARVVLCGNREIFGNDCVYAYGNSKVTACGSSTVTAYDNSTVTAYDNSKVRNHERKNSNNNNYELVHALSHPETGHVGVAS